MSQEKPEHITVLLHEAVTALAVKPNGIYVDGTFGRGGHSRLILTQLGSQGRLIVFDKDPQAIIVAEKLAIEDKRVVVVHKGFTDLGETLDLLNIEHVDGVLLDLGISSPQIDEGARGFSFRFDAPLDMRMDTTQGQTAEQWLNEADEEEIREVIKSYGEERFNRQIAAAIVAGRAEKPIRTTFELAKLVANVVYSKERGPHPATKTFQAIRIYINRELDELDAVLPQIGQHLRIGGRAAIISFHSLEDRRVKQFFKEHAQNKPMPKWAMIRENDLPTPPLSLIGKAQKPSNEEVSVNPRARSARLRVAERSSSAWIGCE